MSKVWFVTGASRGLGAHIALAALNAGDRVVVTARRIETLDSLFPDSQNTVLKLALDVTDPSQATAAIEAAKAHFGQIDVLVNNAGYGQLGPFETNSLEEVQRQFATNVFGVMNVCRAALPIMRQQRRGHVFNLSSISGVIGMGGAALYCASKFAVEGFSESLAQEVAGFGIHVTLIEPGVFRTDFLDDSSAGFGEVMIEDYATFSEKVRASCAAGNHQQTGDPALLGAVVVALANHPKPPVRFLAGTDAYTQVSAKLGKMLEEVDQWREQTVSTDRPQ